MTRQLTGLQRWMWIVAGVVVVTVAVGVNVAAELQEYSAPEVILKTQKPPEYPPAARAARISGVVMVEIQIDTEGKVGEVDILECTHPKVGFEDAAATAVKKWRFEPAQLDDEPLKSTLKFRLTFNYAGVGGGPSVSAGGIADQGIPKTPGSVRRTDAATGPRIK